MGPAPALFFAKTVHLDLGSEQVGERWKGQQYAQREKDERGGGDGSDGNSSLAPAQIEDGPNDQPDKNVAEVVTPESGPVDL